MDIQERVKKIIAEHLHLDENKVVPGALLVENLGADSLHVVEIVMKVEEEFGIEVSDDDLEKLKTVGDVIEYIIKKKSQ